MELVSICVTVSQSWPADSDGILVRRCVKDVNFSFSVPDAAANALAWWG